MKVSARIPRLQESSEEIRKRVKYLLSAADVKNKLPTPKEDILGTAKLIEVGEIELSEYEEGWLRRGTNFFKSALSKIKGLLDFKEKIIYISPDIHHSQKTFVTYHEVTHRVLPWHEILYDPHLDTDYSIDPRVATGLEIEANFGASLIQFQIDRFAKELKDLPLGLASAKYLADRFETSLHSTFRKYIEDNHRSCALLVLQGVIDEIPNYQSVLQLWYPLQSEEFTIEFGMLDWEKFYYPGHPIYDTVFSNSLRSFNEGEMVLKDLREFDKKCKIESFYNTFNYFVLIHTIPRLPSRKKIIILERS